MIANLKDVSLLFAIGKPSQSPLEKWRKSVAVADARECQRRIKMAASFRQKSSLALEYLSSWRIAEGCRGSM